MNDDLAKATAYRKRRREINRRAALKARRKFKERSLSVKKMYFTAQSAHTELLYEIRRLDARKKALLAIIDEHQRLGRCRIAHRTSTMTASSSSAQSTYDVIVTQQQQQQPVRPTSLTVERTSSGYQRAVPQLGCQLSRSFSEPLTTTTTSNPDHRKWMTQASAGARIVRPGDRSASPPSGRRIDACFSSTSSTHCVDEDALRMTQRYRVDKPLPGAVEDAEDDDDEDDDDDDDFEYGSRPTPISRHVDDNGRFLALMSTFAADPSTSDRNWTPSADCPNLDDDDDLFHPPGVDDVEDASLIWNDILAPSQQHENTQPDVSVHAERTADIASISDGRSVDTIRSSDPTTSTVTDTVSGLESGDDCSALGFRFSRIGEDRFELDTAAESKRDQEDIPLHVLQLVDDAP